MWPEVCFPGNVQNFESLASRLRCGSTWIDRLLASILPGFKAVSVSMGYRSGLLSSGPSVVAKEPSTKVEIEKKGVLFLEQRCPCVAVLVEGRFLCSVSGVVNFLLSSSYFFWEPGLSRTVRFFDFSTIVRDFITLERYADAFACPCRVCWTSFSAPRQLICYSVLEFGVHRCGCLGVDVQSDSAEVHHVRFGCLRKIFACLAKVRGRALRNPGGQSSLDSHPRGRPCCVSKDVLPSIRQLTWSTVENGQFLFDATAESALAVQV